MSTLLLKRNASAGVVPAAGSIAVGELAINTTDGILYTKLGSGSVVPLAAYTTAPTTASGCPIIDNTLTAPPTGPSVGDGYIVAASPTGAWTGQANNIAEWTGHSWVFSTPTTGTNAVICRGTNAFQVYTWSGSAWVQRPRVKVTTITATSSFTPTTGAIQTIIEMVGGGGSGGGANATTLATQGSTGGCGATGAYLKFMLSAAQIGTAAITVTIGAGGAAAAAGAAGNPGGTTSFGSFASCTGGGAGAAPNTAGTGLVGVGTSTGGTATVTTGTSIVNISGAITGGSLIYTTAGFYLSDKAGSNPIGFGGGKGNSGASVPSFAGAGYGSGSSGAANLAAVASAQAGVAAQNGVCIITEYF